MFNDKIIFKLFASFGIVIFIVVCVRLLHLQVVEGSRYASFASSQVDARLSVSKNRGYIYDADGELLARNKSTASIYAFRKNINNMNTFIKSLGKNGVTLSGKTRDSIRKTDGFTWIERQMDLDKAVKMTKNIQGLEYFKEEARFYPQGTMMANVIGFTGVDNQGRTGIEYALDKELKGVVSSVASMKDSRGRLILFDDKSDMQKPDTEIYLTISSRIQSAAEYILRKGAAKFGARNGSVIAMDIRTGEIILSADVHAFDPHEYNKYPEDYWKNHTLTYVYEPGSIFKTVSFSYLYENKKLNRSKLIDTSKKVSIGGYTYSDTKNYGILTVDEVFTHSSNIGMVTLMASEKNSDFYDFLKLAGFGSKTGVYGQIDEAGILKDSPAWSKTSKTSIAIGYEVMVTPLQIARFYAAVANGGVMVNPKIISKMVKHGIDSRPENKEVRIMSSETADYILALMQKTVEDGTGVNAKTQLTKVAGKTGTASIYDFKTKQYSKQNYSASFAGVFPADDPKVAMVVVYESPTSSIYGGSTAANVFRQIAEYVSTERQYMQPSLKVANATE